MPEKSEDVLEARSLFLSWKLFGIVHMVILLFGTQRGEQKMKARFADILATLMVATFLCNGNARSQDTAPWPVSGKLLGENGEKAEDVSGIACTTETGFPRICLIIDDEVQGAQFVVLKDGAVLAGEFVRLIDDTHEGKMLELDGEGVAYADGHFYVIGSHGHPRDKDQELDPVKDAPMIQASIRASSKVIRIKVDASSVDNSGKLVAPLEIKVSTELRSLLSMEPRLQPFLDKRLDQNGLTIEGVAVREGRVFVGMRGPMLGKDEAAIYSVALNSLFDNKSADPQLFSLALGEGRGIRDLVTYDRGFLVLAGPSEESDGAYAVYFWDGKDSRLLAELPKFIGKKGKLIKPEALLPLDRNTQGLRVLVLFDGPKEGSPRAISLPPP